MGGTGEYKGFTMMRVYVGGPKHGDREVDTRDLTWDQTRDEKVFPWGCKKTREGTTLCTPR